MKLLTRLSALVLLVLSSLLFATSSIKATETTTTATIKTELTQMSQTFEYWKIGNDETVEGLFQRTAEELTELYGQPEAQDQTAQSTELHLTLVIGQRYYVRQKTGSGDRLVVPFIIDPRTAEPMTIVAKYTVPNKTGHYPFVKVSSQGGTLAGAVFQIDRKSATGDYQPVERDGESYRVISGQDGRFSVENLPYGQYVLREIKAPKGYKKLREPIPFEITAHSAQMDPHKIVNIPVTPPKIEIPYTGNAILFIMMVTGFLSFMGGWYLIRKDKK